MLRYQTCSWHLSLLIVLYALTHWLMTEKLNPKKHKMWPVWLNIWYHEKTFCLFLLNYHTHVRGCKVNFHFFFFYADSIETNIITAADNVESGNQQLNAAASYQVSVILKEEWNDMQKLIQNFALFHQIDRKLCACEPFLSSDSLTVKFDLMLNCIKRVENQCIGSTAGGNSHQVCWLSDSVLLIQYNTWISFHIT